MTLSASKIYADRKIARNNGNGTASLSSRGTQASASHVGKSLDLDAASIYARRRQEAEQRGRAAGDIR